MESWPGAQSERQRGCDKGDFNTFRPLASSPGVLRPAHARHRLCNILGSKPANKLTQNHEFEFLLAEPGGQHAAAGVQEGEGSILRPARLPTTCPDPHEELPPFAALPRGAPGCKEGPAEQPLSKICLFPTQHRYHRGKTRADSSLEREETVPKIQR